MFRTIATSAAILVFLALVGAVAGPRWDPVPVSDHLVPATSDTTIQGVDPEIADRIGDVGQFEVLETPVTIPLDGVEVGGLLRQPLDEAGEVLADRPGVVYVHGAGTGKSTEAFTESATALASAGVVTLVPDKRLDTYTTRDRDYVAMAADYEHSVELLRTTEGVDPERVGAYGESEGTWIVPVMQAKDPDLAFTVLVSAPVVPPRVQAAFAVDNYLRNTGVPEQVFRAIPRAVGMQLPGGGFEYVDFDVRPWLEQQTAPVLVVYGTADPSMPIEQGARQIIADTSVSGDDAPVTVRFYAGANHGIHVVLDGGMALHPDFGRDVSTWVQGLPGTADAAPRIAGDTPGQLYLALPVPQPFWWGNGDIVVGGVLMGAGLIVLGPLVWVVHAGVRRTVRRRAAVPAPRLARGLGSAVAGLGAGSVATMVALVVYLLAVARLALDYQRDDLVVQGGWVGVRLLGVATAVAAALVLRRVTDVRAARRAVPAGAEAAGAAAAEAQDVAVARGWPAHLTLWCVLVGSVVLLFTLAYWGVYQLGI
ncbi:prolyl oligopeptidase family serine peptidase [Isoptericola sp. NEAU-Y5]|uniref:Prolyl oligopeptidase family serine peptidase n=1 Tax=Isoptericola luteus TaxID=2879484 RepID=A0ABS7ZM77_9MICO|nr:prolyl oligopeptidase family serine peptidase [Isoptericola sp. NEAU-Y5]MCA5894890.1 prolyl oligopeptidase family serine peptidase [Isoptericola sp. NEAU-Y5]